MILERKKKRMEQAGTDSENLPANESSPDDSLKSEIIKAAANKDNANAAQATPAATTNNVNKSSSLPKISDVNDTVDSRKSSNPAPPPPPPEPQNSTPQVQQQQQQGGLQGPNLQQPNLIQQPGLQSLDLQQQQALGLQQLNLQQQQQQQLSLQQQQQLQQLALQQQLGLQQNLQANQSLPLLQQQLLQQNQLQLQGNTLLTDNAQLQNTLASLTPQQLQQAYALGLITPSTANQQQQINTALLAQGGLGNQLTLSPDMLAANNILQLQQNGINNQALRSLAAANTQRNLALAGTRSTGDPFTALLAAHQLNAAQRNRRLAGLNTNSATLNNSGLNLSNLNTNPLARGNATLGVGVSPLLQNQVPNTATLRLGLQQNQGLQF